jgi:DNA-binding GntR family transcriptional regulator
MQTLRQQVHAVLRERIMRREMQPGQQLVERELAAELGVSRTPVRECLLLLQMEGLADTSPGLGVVVRDVTVHQVREALAVRGALDALAAQEACRSRSDEDLALLKAAIRSHEVAVRSGEEQRIALADSQFHARIYDAAGNSVLTSVRSAFGLYETFYFHADFCCYTPQAFARSLERHRQLIAAIAARDETRAAEVARRHLQEAAALTRDGCGERARAEAGAGDGRRARPLRLTERASRGSRAGDVSPPGERR